MTELVEGRASSSTPSASFAVRAYVSGDETALAELQRQASRVADGPLDDAARWLAKLAPEDGELENVWIATDPEGGAIGQYAGIERHFDTPWGRRRAVIAVDALTAPAWRRRGVLTALVTRAHRAWRADGVSFVLGLPNEQWGSRTEALNWRPLFPLRWRVRPLRPLALLSSKLRRRAAEGALSRSMGRLWNALWQPRSRGLATVSACDPAAPSLGDLSAELGSPDRLLARRDDAWLARRFSRWPLGPYRVLVSHDRQQRASGYAAFRLATLGTGDRSRRFGYLADLVCKPGDRGAADALLSGVVGELREQRVEGIWTLVPDHPPHSSDLWRHGFLPTHRSFSVHLVPLDRTPPLGALRDPRRWNLSGGDFDVI